MHEWGKEEIQKAYAGDTRARELRKERKNNNNIQEKEGILYWKG